MTTAPSHERTVARLIADVRPVRPLWSPHVRLALWLGLQVVAIGCAVGFGLRDDLGLQLRRPLFVLEVALWMTAGSIAAAMALRAAVPGRENAPFEIFFWLLLACAALVVASLDAGEPAPAGWRFVTGGVQCVVSTVAFATIPLTALFVAVRRGAPLAARAAGLYAGAAAFLCAAAAVRIACPIDAKLHLLTWHTSTVAIGTVLSAVAGARWLDWQGRAIRTMPAGGAL